MPPPDRPVEAELVWAGDLKFGATSGSSAIVVDGDAVAGPSPMQLVAEGLAACMASDIVTILAKGRHAITGLRVSLSADRAPETPRRYTRVSLVFHVTGDVPAAAVERAVALSRATYCSVWHSLRQDIELVTTFGIHP